MNALTPLELAEELAESWLNGNRTHVATVLQEGFGALPTATVAIVIGTILDPAEAGALAALIWETS